VSGDYAFVGNRQYGVEVVDISDPTKPVHTVNIHSGEVQSCVVYDNILYAGVWGECGVYMYDLADVKDSSYITPVGKVTTDGKGDGLSVVKIGDEVYMFAATGHHTYAASTSSKLDNLAYGQGNGMDIYNVTDPANPKWVANAKIDGRYYYHINDYWETEVAYDENSGKWYAYLVNTYNGVYIFDVTNVYAPVRLAHITLTKAATSLTHATRAIITPWNQSEEGRGPVGAVVIDDGVMYIAGTETDIHVYRSQFSVAHHVADSAASLDNVTSGFYDFENKLTSGSLAKLAEGGYQLYDTDGQVVSVAIAESYIYVSAGSDGIIILNKSDLSYAGKIAAPVMSNGRIGFAQDAKIRGSKLYVAFDIAGLCVYDISGSLATAPLLLWSYTAGSEIARQVSVSADGKFVVVQLGTNKAQVISTDTHNRVEIYSEQAKKNITTITTSGGNIYHHQMIDLIDSRYVGIWNHISSEYWIDFGPADAPYSVPKLISGGGSYEGCFNGGLGMYGGATEYVENGVTYSLKVLQNKNVIVTNNYTTGATTKTLFTAVIAGRPTVVGDYLVICNRSDSKIAIYEISTGTLLGVMKVDGNPDIAYADGTKIYISLGYQGLLVIDTAVAFKA
jgi:hypothetical protein